jgi:hypothetical protein
MLPIDDLMVDGGCIATTGGRRLFCIFVISGDTLYHGVKVTSVRIMRIFLVNVSMNCWCLLEPSSAFMVIVWDNLVWYIRTLRSAS